MRLNHSGLMLVRLAQFLLVLSRLMRHHPHRRAIPAPGFHLVRAALSPIHIRIVDKRQLAEARLLADHILEHPCGLRLVE